MNIGIKPPEGSPWDNIVGLNIGQIIGGLISLALIAASVIFFFMLVIGGIRWIVSGGDKAQTEAARGQITAALIGLVIVFAAWAIARIIGTFFGVELFGTEGLQLPSVVPSDTNPDNLLFNLIPSQVASIYNLIA